MTAPIRYNPRPLPETTQGIEPLFATSYRRCFRSNPEPEWVSMPKGPERTRLKAQHFMALYGGGPIPEDEDVTEGQNRGE